MAPWAIIPVKPFAQGKSRLAGVLAPAEREALNRRLFERVFHAALDVIPPDRIAVVTSEAALLAEVARRGAHGVAENAPGDLNAALALACRHAGRRGADAILVLPADLPGIAGADVAAMREAIGSPPCCAIAPDAAGHGTNALALAPPDADLFRLGPQSFPAHVALAAARGLPMQIVHRPGLAQDLDTPEDYRRLIGGAEAGLRADAKSVAS